MNECGYCTRMVKMVIKKLIPFYPTTKTQGIGFIKERRYELIYMKGAIVKNTEGYKILNINFQDADLIGETFGTGDDKCNVAETIEQVQKLYMNWVTDYCYPHPKVGKIRVDYVDEPIDGINITWKDGDNQSGYFVGINQHHYDNIFLTYPLKYMTAKQLLTHELGHWFFNRLIEKLIHADRRTCREDINSYETNFSEKAAHYCEIKIAGKRKKYTSHDEKLIENIENIQKEGVSVLKTIKKECMQQ